MSINIKKPLIGFDRFITFDWLDQTAKWVIDGKTAKEVHDLIDDYLAPSVKGETSKRKTKNLLSGAWVKSDSINHLFKEQAKELYLNATKQEKIVIHYGLFSATYPFFYSLSQILGRLFKLQDDITNVEFYRRVVEIHGDRESVKRAAARYLQSLVDWGLLDGTEKAKVKPTNKIQIINPEIVTWLLGAALFSNARDKLSTDDLLFDPTWFPFVITAGSFQVNQSKFLEVIHQGVGNDLLALKGFEAQ